MGSQSQGDYTNEIRRDIEHMAIYCGNLRMNTHTYMCMCACVCVCIYVLAAAHSCLTLFATLWTVGCQTSLSMDFPGEEILEWGAISTPGILPT